MKITINKKSYTIKFDYGCLREVSKMWGIKGVSAVPNHVASGAVDEFDGCVDLVYASVISSGQPGSEKVTLNEIGDFFLENPKRVTEAVALLIASFPKPDEDQGKQPAAK